MNILVVGSHGQIGRQLVERLADGPHRVTAMVRSAGQEAEMRERGADATVVVDLEGDLAPAFEADVDCVVFTAGSGPHTGPEKTDAVDRDGAIRLVDACVERGIRRFVMVSALRVGCPEQAPASLRHYLEAKAVADDHLRATDLDYTVLRPGRLNDDPGTGRIAAGLPLPADEIPRADVAAALAVILDRPATIGRTIDITRGETPVEEAFRA